MRPSAAVESRPLPYCRSCRTGAPGGASPFATVTGQVPSTAGAGDAVAATPAATAAHKAQNARTWSLSQKATPDDLDAVAKSYLARLHNLAEDAEGDVLLAGLVLGL